IRVICGNLRAPVPRSVHGLKSGVIRGECASASSSGRAAPLGNPYSKAATLILPLYRRPRETPRDLRRQMIAETGAFLTWALRERPSLPRIPRRRVDQGGFAT